MGLRNLFDHVSRIETGGKQEKGKMGSTVKRFHHLVKCSIEKKSRPRKTTKIDSKATGRMMNHSTNFQLNRLTRLLNTSKQNKELPHQERVWSNRTISKLHWPNAPAIVNTTFVNCTLESCRLSNCKLTGCFLTNCKAVDSELSDTLISWHHFENYEEWFFENCKFLNCILQNALVKNSELHRSNIELATTYKGRNRIISDYGRKRVVRVLGPGFFVRRSYLQVCTLRSCSISKAIVTDSQLSEACMTDFVTIARCSLGDSIIRQSTAIESAAINCQLFTTTIQHCALSGNSFIFCEEKESILHRLPPEIRLKIYQYSIDHFPSSIYLVKKHDSELRNLIAALRGDQELYQEALGVRDRYVGFEYRAQYNGPSQGCSFTGDPLPEKAWRSLQRLTLQFAFQEPNNGREIVADRLRRANSLKYLRLEIQDFGWLDPTKFWAIIGLLSELPLLTQLSIMFYPKLNHIRASPRIGGLLRETLELLSRYGLIGGQYSQFVLARYRTIPADIQQYLPALDKAFGVKSYTDGLPGINGCSWIWQASKGETLKMGPLPVYA